MLAQKTRIFYYVHKPKQPTALIYFKRLASRVRCSFCKGVFNLCYTTLLGLKGNMCLRRMSVSRSKRLNKEIPDRCWRKDRKPHCELFSVFIIHSLTCFMQANLVPFWFWLVQVRVLRRILSINLNTIAMSFRRCDAKNEIVPIGKASVFLSRAEALSTLSSTFVSVARFVS